MKQPSISAAVTAFCLVALALGGWYWNAEARMKREFNRLALGNLKASRLGLTTDEMVLRQKGWLPVYGSCELVYPQRNRIDHFFASKPTGFRVAPNGDRGVRSLLMAERFAALGENLRGRKLVVILTPEWFYSSDVGADTYDGNFSVTQALGALSSATLDPSLKERLAIRMADYPESLAKSPFLTQLAGAITGHAQGVELVAGGLAWGFQKVQKTMDPLMIAQGIQDNQRAHPDLLPAASPRKIDWDNEVEQSFGEFQEMAGSNPFGFRDTLWAKFQKHPKEYLLKMSDEDFARRLARTKEWEDYDLMLGILKQYGARPLLVSLPVNGKYLASVGVSQAAWSRYYSQIAEVAARYGFPVADFNKFDTDPKFFGYADPNPEGWVYINRVVDAYYHDRLGTVLGLL